MTNQSATVTEPARETWPSPDFLNKAQRLRYDLEAAIRDEQQLTQRVTDIQNRAFNTGIPVAVIVGGADKLSKLAAEQEAASEAVNQKRAELRDFLNSSRAGFFSLREESHESLRPGISEKFARVRECAAEVLAELRGLLGAEAEAVREEKTIRQWNREVRKFNRTIPAINSAAIPAAAAIGTEESIRALVVSFLMQDQNIRELCRDYLSREGEKRERAAANEEARFLQAEVNANPFLLDKPF